MAINCEVEIEYDDALLAIDVVNGQVTISEIMPGMTMPLEELTWANGRLTPGSELSAGAYQAIEAAIHEELQRRG